MKIQSIALALALTLTGCTSNIVTAPSPSVTGNWKFASSATPVFAAQASIFEGGLVSAGSQVTGTLHTALLPGQSNLCFSSATGIPVTGTIDNTGHLALTSQPFAGSTLTLTGQYNASTRTLHGTSVAVTGGACAEAVTPAVGLQYQPISGTYNGTFASAQGGNIPVSATLNQTTTQDANGSFHLTGSATFTGDPSCLVSPAVSDSTVTGNTLTVTYSESHPPFTTTVTATGTFNTDATVLTISGYSVSGNPNCVDSGSGTLTKQ